MERLSNEEIQKLLAEYDYRKSLRGRLKKLSQDFVNSLNPKYLKAQRAKDRFFREHFKAEIKEQYGMSEAEAEAAFKEVEYMDSWRGRLGTKLANLGQTMKSRFSAKTEIRDLTDAEIEELLKAKSKTEPETVPGYHYEREF